MDRNKKIGIIGGGNMGEALIKGLLGVPGMSIAVSDVSRSRLRFLQRNYRIQPALSNIELARRAGVIILAVKPHAIGVVLSEIKPFLNEEKLIISIAAGITTRHIEKLLGGLGGRRGRKIAVIRAMPNMPALAGKGISAICAGNFAKNGDRQIAAKILSSVGKAVEVKEAFMDAVTAISGSGPAYFFFLIEVLIGIGVKRGLNEETARELAVQTAFGSASVILESRQDPRILRQKVTSKGGTTEAAFKIFQRDGLGRILENGITAAIKRSKELRCS